MYFDTHAHYDADAFDQDREKLLLAAHEAGVELIINPGCDVRSSETALSLAERFSFVYAAVGIHPEELDSMNESSLARIEEFSSHPKCVAIGEIGLDYYWDAEHKETQKAIFRAQLELALRVNKPVIIHDREAHGDALGMVLEYPALRGVFHCFSGSVEMAKELIKRDFYLGFDGPVTYKNARKTLEVLEYCPMDRILIETDSPYLSPVPLRGKRNDSRNLSYIAARIGEIKGISTEEAAAATLANGKRLLALCES